MGAARAPSWSTPQVGQGRCPAALCRALADCNASERTRLVERLQEDSRFEYVRRSWQASPEQAGRVAALNLPGIGLQEDTGRYYPLGSLAAHVVGFVNQDNVGQAGLVAEEGGGFHADIMAGTG